MSSPFLSTQRPRTNRILAGAALAGVALIAGAVGRTIWKTRNYYWKPVERALKHGYTERQMSVREGLTLNSPSRRRTRTGGRRCC